MIKREGYLEIGKAIRFFRERNNETDYSMAFKLGYKDHSSYAKIERGEIESMDILKLREICEILNISLCEMLVRAEICHSTQRKGECITSC
jgi:transcriptional regulator with XRE-family HTH domain